MLSATTMLRQIRSRKHIDEHILHVVLLVLTIAVGTALRFYHLGAEDFWFDELIMVQEVNAGLESILEEARGGRPPVSLVLAYFWTQIFGTSEAAARSLSALAGTLCLPIIYAIGRELAGRRVALVATVLMALSEFQLFYAQEFRYYSVFLLFTLLSFLCYILFLKHGTYRSMAFYVLTSILMFFSHTSGAFILVAQGLTFLLQARRHRPIWGLWLVSQILIALAIAPMVLHAATSSVSGSAGVQSWIPVRPWWYPLETLQKFICSERFYVTPKRVGASTAWLVLGMGLFILWKGRAQWLEAVKAFAPTVWRNIILHREPLILVGLWLLCPILILFGLSKLSEPVYVHRYVIGAAPAFYLLLAMGLVSLRRIVPLPVFFGIFVLMNGLGTYEYYLYDDKEQWSDMVAYVDAQSRSGDVMVFAPDEQERLQTFFFMYSQGSLPGCSLTSPQQDAATLTRDLTACTAGHDRFWLVMRGQEKRTGNLRDFFFEREHATMQLNEQHDFRGIEAHLFTLR